MILRLAGLAVGLSALAAPALAADARGAKPRPLTVARTMAAETTAPCPAVPTIVAPGRRSMGEPGSFYARWEWAVPRRCNALVITR